MTLQDRRISLGVLVALGLVGASSPARAQMGPGGMPNPQTMPTDEEEKPEGPAEEAPPDAVVNLGLPPPPKLDSPGGIAKDKKTLAFTEIHGYLRLRTDLFHKLGLGLSDKQAFRSCNSLTQICDDETIGSSNMRMRLEPTFNIDEQVKIQMQIDVLDNQVLGATPEGYAGNQARPANVPLNAFAGGQVPAEAGKNSPWDAVRVKRAWAEVRTPLGVLLFGRMPSHWGMGILANSGGWNRTTESWCLDCDFGDSADRVMFVTEIPGTASGKPDDPRLRVAVGMDWAATGLTDGIASDYRNRYDGQPRDITDDDDVRQWVFVVGKFHTPPQWKTKVQRGQLAWDYGLYAVYRAQDKDTDLKGTAVGSDPVKANLVNRDASAWIFDATTRLRWRKWSAEAELVAIVGSIGESKELSPANPELDVLQFGGVARAQYRALENDMRLGIEVGYASGDQAEATGGSLNYRGTLAIQPQGDSRVSNFRFDPDYQVDLILFREILGVVTNTVYFKPSMEYDLTGSIMFNAASIVSFVDEPVATPANSRMYGMEFDADLSYKNVDKAGRGFHAGIAYGVFFPFSFLDDNSALSHPAFDPADGAAGPIWSGSDVGDAETAHTLQTRLLVVF